MSDDYTQRQEGDTPRSRPNESRTDLAKAGKRRKATVKKSKRLKTSKSPYTKTGE